MATTLKDIARESGAAVPTVSLVLNGRAKELGISDALTEKILAAAAKLNYRRNQAAKATASGRFDAVGLLCSANASGGSMPQTMLWSIEQELMKSEQLLVLAQAKAEQFVEGKRLPRIIQEWSIDGMLVHYTEEPESLPEILGRFEIPNIWINVKHENDCVFPDDFGGAAEGTRRLIELGHRRIGYLGNKFGAHYSTQDRYNGYAHAMTEAGLAIDQFPRYDEQQKTIDIRPWLGGDERPTAVITVGPGSDVMIAAAQLDLEIPRDLSLMAIREHLNPIGITRPCSMAIPVYEVGRVSVQQIVKRIKTPDRPLPNIAVPYTYDDGNTCAPPRE